MGKNPEAVALAETAAAISDTVHSYSAAYQTLYDNVCDEWSGFPGIWIFVGQCAVAYHEWYEREPDRAAAGERFIDDCEAIGHAILRLTSYPIEVKNMMGEDGYKGGAFMIGVHNFVINVIHARHPIAVSN